MKDKDVDDAVRLLVIWLIAFSLGLIIADKSNVAAGLVLSISSTIVAVVIIYCDWRNEQTKNRLDNYIDDANKRAKEVLKTAAEKTFENKIKKYLDDQGAWFVKYWAGAQYTKSGIPDILCCINGYFVGIEVKAPNGKPSEIQLFNVKKINRAGGFAFVLYPSAFEKFKRFIENLENDRYNRDEIPEIWK